MALLWKELHTRALEMNNGENDTPFLTQFATKIPKYTKCNCKAFWKKYIRSNPPKFGSNGEYFAWTVNCHNAVNQKLGKPIVSLGDAKKLYIVE